MKKTALFILKYLSPAWRDYIFGIKRFGSKNRIFPPEQMLIFFTEKGKWHGGFADRMKGIVSLFQYCLCKNISFKINHLYPFDLADFLQPNQYDWQIKTKEITFHKKEAKLIFLYGKNKVKRLLKLNTQKQIHVFFNFDITAQLNQNFNTNYAWGELYKKLFKPTETLQTAIDEKLKTINGKYIAAVFRFQNMLGDFAEYKFKPLLENEKIDLIAKCKQAILNLQKVENNNSILVTADSELFLKQVADLENVFAFPAKVVHIDSVSNADKNVYMKSFVDFYLLAESEKIYSFGTKAMYRTEFPMYAAKVNDISFERILIE